MGQIQMKAASAAAAAAWVERTVTAVAEEAALEWAAAAATAAADLLPVAGAQHTDLQAVRAWCSMLTHKLRSHTPCE